MTQGKAWKRTAWKSLSLIFFFCTLILKVNSSGDILTGNKIPVIHIKLLYY